MRILLYFSTGLVDTAGRPLWLGCSTMGEPAARGRWGGSQVAVAIMLATLTEEEQPPACGLRSPTRRRRKNSGADILRPLGTATPHQPPPLDHHQSFTLASVDVVGMPVLGCGETPTEGNVRAADEVPAVRPAAPLTKAFAGSAVLLDYMGQCRSRTHTAR